MVTIKDISKITGYSATTVSKSLNDYPEIPKETRDKIKKFAFEMGYVPNISARSLKTNKSWTIGVIYEENSGIGLQHPLFSKILESFRKEVEREGYDIMFISKTPGGKQSSFYEHSLMKRVEAIFTVCAGYNSPEMQQIFASSIPNVVIDYVGTNTNTITSGINQSVFEAIQHLKSLGHTKIAHIYGKDITYVGKERKRIFLDVMQKLELPIVNDYLVSGEFFSRAEGYYAMKQLLDLADLPTAVFCASDTLAIGAIEAIMERDLKVPQDISVIGFDGIDIAQMYRPRLNTILQDTKQMGILAAKLIFAMIVDYHKPTEAIIHEVESIYLEKDTVAPVKK